jgi:hypothetical protein
LKKTLHKKRVGGVAQGIQNNNNNKRWIWHDKVEKIRKMLLEKATGAKPLELEMCLPVFRYSEEDWYLRFLYYVVC